MTILFLSHPDCEFAVRLKSSSIRDLHLGPKDFRKGKTIWFASYLGGISALRTSSGGEIVEVSNQSRCADLAEVVKLYGGAGFAREMIDFAPTLEDEKAYAFSLGEDSWNAKPEDSPAKRHCHREPIFLYRDQLMFAERVSVWLEDNATGPRVINTVGKRHVEVRFGDAVDEMLFRTVFAADIYEYSSADCEIAFNSKIMKPMLDGADEAELRAAVMERDTPIGWTPARVTAIKNAARAVLADRGIAA